MKKVDPQNLILWTQAEKILTMNFNAEYTPEALRTSGLLAIQRNAWASALLRLEEAVRNGVRDLQTLDALGEAAYQTKTYHALLPYKDLYREPMIAIHFCRSLMMLGQIDFAREFLVLAPESLLKDAIIAVLGVENNIETAIAAVVKPSTRADFAKLNSIEYWQALAPIAAVAGRDDLVKIAEIRLKALAYDRPVIHYNQSLRFLAEGDFKAGWKLYEWRLVPGSPCLSETAYADFSMWEGEFLKDRKILVVMENGFGDQVFSLRYLQVLVDEGASVEVAICDELMGLVHSSFPNIQLHNIKEANNPNYWLGKSVPDYWVHAFSIPARAGAWDPIYTEGYLQASPSLVETCRSKINIQNPKGLPVHGVVWHGDIRTAPMRTRAYSIKEFLNETEILKTPSVILSLQKDITSEELEELKLATQKAGSVLVDVSSTLHNFSHTAAWIKCVDQMWSCDTATAHLAGALGVKTTVMIRNKSIWNWLCDSSTMKSVWYSSCRIKYALTPKFSFMFDIRS